MGKLEEIRVKVAKLRLEAKEVKRMKSDCNSLRKFRRMIVKEKFD